MITERNTKAEIMAAYVASQTALSEGPSWSQVWDKMQQTRHTISRETVLLIKDCYDAGRATRRAYDRIVPGIVADIKRFPFKA